MMPPLWDYVLVALWGWLGLFLALLMAWQLADQAFRPKPLLSGRDKALVAVAILAFGLVSAWRDRSLDIAAMEAELERQRWVSTPLPPASQDKLKRNMEPLRRDLEKNRQRD